MKELKKGSIFASAFREIPDETLGEMAVPIVIGRSIRQVRLQRHVTGELAEWSNAAVLKTVEGNTSGGSNPSFSAETMFQKKHKISKTL